jgi:hypothetical protein
LGTVDGQKVLGALEITIRIRSVGELREVRSFRQNGSWNGPFSGDAEEFFNFVTKGIMIGSLLR